MTVVSLSQNNGACRLTKREFALFFQIMTKIPSAWYRQMFYSFCMKVYIEYVLADNLVMDLFLLFVSARVARQKIANWRLWLASVIGSVGAVCVSLLGASPWCLLAKTLLFFVMTAVAFAQKDFKKSLFACVLFGVFTFVTGGAVIGLFYFFKVDFFDGATLSYISQVPFGLIVLGVLSVAWLARCIVAETKKQRALKSFGCVVSFTLFGKKREMQGIFDSGNTLVEGGLPVCFLCSCYATNQIRQEVSQAVLQGTPPKNLRQVRFVTVEGEGQALAFEAEDFFIDGLPRRSLLAFGRAGGNGFDVLVNSYFTEEY